MQKKTIRNQGANITQLTQLSPTEPNRIQQKIQQNEKSVTKYIATLFLPKQIFPNYFIFAAIFSMVVLSSLLIDAPPQSL